MTDIVILDKRDSRSWALIPAYVRRIKSFVHDYGTDGDADLLVKQFMTSFICDRPVMKGAIALNDNGEDIAHLLCEISDVSPSVRAMWVTQYQIDARIGRSELKNTMDIMERWGMSMGCSEARSTALDEACARMDSVFWGFTKHRIVMRKELGNGREQQ